MVSLKNSAGTGYYLSEGRFPVNLFSERAGLTTSYQTLLDVSNVNVKEAWNRRD